MIPEINSTITKNGDIELGKTTESHRKGGGVEISQKLKLKTPFPEWAFFSSDDLPNVFKLSDEDFNQYFNSAHELYEKIAKGLKSNNISSIMHLFEERNKEIDIAYYKKPGSTKAALEKSFTKVISNPSAEMLSIDKKYLTTYTYGNNKLLTLVRTSLSEALLFNLNDINATKAYPIVLRREDNKWIITR